MGSYVAGYSLKADKNSLFKSVEKKLKNKFIHIENNILDLNNLKKSIKEFEPDVIIHLAAQSLVRKSYKFPLLTWETNVLGSLNILEASKGLNKKCSIVMVTTDKVYKNNEWVYGYRENDNLGGHDPYSASKAGSEIAISSWRLSFCNEFSNNNLHIATARAGNVIGGGDWSEDRIIPDIINSLMNKKIIPIRNPLASRPWQHVLEPLSGYLILAKRIYEEIPSSDYEAFNFGPDITNNKTVKELVEEVIKSWPGKWENANVLSSYHEAINLHLQNEKAIKLLGWKPRWDFKKTVFETIFWYKDVLNGDDAFKSVYKILKNFFVNEKYLLWKMKIIFFNFS